MAYDEEEVAARETFTVPVSRHPLDSVNLADPKLGLMDLINDLLARAGLEKGRVDIALPPIERDAGLTVNEYETLLMRHDLVEVLQNPLKFAAQRGRHMIDDPLAIPSKTINYAKYDVPRLLNSLMEALRWERVGAGAARGQGHGRARPAAPPLAAGHVPRLGRRGHRPRPDGAGDYQSPILVQWRPSDEPVPAPRHHRRPRCGRPRARRPRRGPRARCGHASPGATARACAR